jgi:hypothetical protein
MIKAEIESGDSICAMECNGEQGCSQNPSNIHAPFWPSKGDRPPALEREPESGNFKGLMTAKKPMT